MCVFVCVCVFFFNPFHTPHLFFCFRVCGYSLMCFLSSCAFFLSFPFLQCTDKHLHLCLFFLPLLIFSPFALHSHRATGSLPHFFSFYPPSQSPLWPLFFFSVKPAETSSLTADFPFYFFPPSCYFHSLLFVFVYKYAHVPFSACVYLCLCVHGCVRGPAPPCPLSLQRLCGSLAFRFKLNHKDESSL